MILDADIDAVDKAAKALFESNDNKMLKAAGFPIDWESQPRTIKLDYRNKVRIVLDSITE